MSLMEDMELGRMNAVTLRPQDCPTDDRLVVKWLEEQPDSRRKQLAQDVLKDLLEKAAQPRHASGNACIKLCYFVDQCKKSPSAELQALAFSEKTCIDLFNFYIEWNEKNQHRSMRQVLELLTSLISLNPDKDSAETLTGAIVERILSIITHQSAQPLVKPAFKSLECFLGKGTISTGALIDSYKDQISSVHYDLHQSFDKELLWDSFMAEVFAWLILQDVSPAAGKLLVTLFVKLRNEAEQPLLHKASHAVLWQRWIRNGLQRNPETLENMKNYLLPPLFRLDQSGSLLFLDDLNHQGSNSGFRIEESNAQSLLHLAAIEVGKKSGLVQEPGNIMGNLQPERVLKKSHIILDESAIGELLTHTLDNVRSLAFSVLISSSSSIRPYSILALDLLQTHISIFYADTDAKFRNDVLSSTRHMIERLRGAAAYLARELLHAKFLLDSNETGGSVVSAKAKEPYEDICHYIERHKKFAAWYLEFLCGELVPTASYQRHITALKAITLLLRSGINDLKSESIDPKVSDNSAIWPFRIRFFTSGNMRLIMDLLMDPFEDVRISAGIVLKFAYSNDFILGAITNVSALDQNGFQAGIDPIERKNDRFSHSNRSTDSPPPLTSCAATHPPAFLKFIDRAQDAAKRTGRADYGDGVARSWEILFRLCSSADSRFKILDDLIEQLEVKVKTAEEDLACAVLEAPIHGSFAALNFVWDAVDCSARNGNSFNQDQYMESGDSLQFRMLACCKRIWKVVREILCNDSPEGSLPLEINEVDSVDTKDVLSYSFRAIHESSNLMRTLIGKIKLNWTDGSPVLPGDVFAEIGHLTYEQLSNIRHRGAFSTVSLTFARCCQLSQYWTADVTSQHSLLDQWYQGALQCIFDQVSTTRRSAGIPALVTGILSSNAANPAFENVMSELMAIARTSVRLSELEETILPQVHSMNCLKEIFKSSLLGKRADNYVADCLKIAVDSLSSEVWAVRNCGLLLLRSIIDALFGTNESKITTEAGWDGRSVKLSFDKYPTLPALLLKLLGANKTLLESSSTPTSSSVESIFPALDILRRAGPPPTHHHEIFRSVSKHLGSEVWHVREIAARTICTLLLHHNWLPEVMKLMETHNNSANRLHGVLMAVRFVLDRRMALDLKSATDDLDKIASLLKSSKMWSFLDRDCPEVLAAYLEVSNSIARIILCSRNTPAVPNQKILNFVIDQLFLRDTYEQFLDLMKMYHTFKTSIGGFEFSVNTALACHAVVRHSIFTSALKEDTLGLQNVVAFAAALDTDIVMAAIKAIPEAWASYSSTDVLFGLIKTYVGAIEITRSPEIRAIAVANLAEVIDKVFGRINPQKGERDQNGVSATIAQHRNLDLNETIRNEIKNLDGLLQKGKRTPSLSNAEIRISGSLLVCEFVSQKHFNRDLATYKPRMEAWGKLLATAGNAINDLETRYAAAAALASFYNNPYFEWYIPNDECVIPSILALYDTLNDDDDEIRNLSAQTVSALLQKSLVPLAARIELAKYISNVHTRARSFAWNLVCRMTGSKLETVDNIRFQLQPVSGQLEKVLTEDDSLFIEEEQNLFIDEVREAKLWTQIFENTVPDNGNMEQEDFDIENTWSQPLAALATWVMDGLLASSHLLNKDDGPLGSTSNPAVFALTTRLLLSANAIIRRHEGLVTSATGQPVLGDRIIGGIILALEQFTALGKERNIHESLLFQV